MKKTLATTVVALALCATSCVGVRSQGDEHTVHAESFHLFGFTIPEDDQKAAWAEVPEGAEVVTVTSDPLDWTSVVGALNNILGFTTTMISYTK